MSTAAENRPESSRSPSGSIRTSWTVLAPFDGPFVGDVFDRGGGVRVERLPVEHEGFDGEFPALAFGLGEEREDGGH
jgi:hypothetical protein